MHMRIQESCTAEGTNYILGQFSKPFKTVPLMVHYYTENRLPIKGAEHTCLRYPICEELLWRRSRVWKINFEIFSRKLLDLSGATTNLPFKLHNSNIEYDVFKVDK